MTLRTGTALLTLGILGVAACADVRARREAAAAQQRRLDEKALPVPLEQSWAAALRLLAERGYPLVGSDRAVGRQPPSGSLGDFLSPGFATRELGDGARAAATGWLDERRPPRVRYRISGSPAPGGSRVRFTRIVLDDPLEPAQLREARDVEMELDLWRQVDASGAEWIETGAAAAAPTPIPTPTPTRAVTTTPDPAAAAN